MQMQILQIRFSLYNDTMRTILLDIAPKDPKLLA